MSTLSNDELLNEIARMMRENSQFRQQLGQAVEAKNESLIQSLIRVAVGALVQVGRAAVSAVVRWLIGG
jgi:hypothetical protein